MASNFKQFRYYGDNSSQNNITKEQLINGEIFTNDIKIIQQLGIKATPGTKFYINNNSSPVIVGFLGVFEINLSGTGGFITHLSFDLNSVNAINENLQGGYIIINILGDGSDLS